MAGEGGTTKGVRIAGAWEEVDIAENDPIWTTGTPCPIPNKFGVPLIVRKENVSFVPSGGLDNQPITYLMIHPKSGFAPPAWQSNIGPAIVARKDKKPLLLNQMDVIYEFMCDLIDEFGESGTVKPERMSKAAFIEHWDEMIEEKKMSQEIDEEDSEEEDPMHKNHIDWDAVPRPF